MKRTMVSLILLFLCGQTAPTTSHGNVNSFSSSLGTVIPIRVDPPDQRDIPLGSGYSFTSSSRLPLSCMTGTVSPNVPRSQYSTVGQYTDVSTLAEALNISAKAQASFILGTIEGEVKFILDQKTEGSSTRIAAFSTIRELHSLTPTSRTEESNVVPRVVMAEGIALKPEQLNILMKQGRNAFERRCGQGYVVAVEKGADLIGFYRFDSTSNDAQQQIRNSLSGSILGQQARISLEKIANSLNKSTAELVTYHQFGGVAQQFPYDKAGFLAAITAFPSTLLQNSPAANYYGYLVVPYGPLTVTNWPEGIPGFSQKSDTSLGKMTEQYWLLRSIYDWLDAVITKPDDYILNWGITLEQVKVHQGTVHDDLHKLKNAISTCVSKASCVKRLPMTSNEAYYAHLAGLPLPKTWSPHLTDLLSAFNSARKAVDDYNQYSIDIVRKGQELANLPGSKLRIDDDRDCYHRNNWKRTHMDPYMADVTKPKLDYLRRADTNFPVQLQLEHYTLLFAPTRRARCDLSNLDIFGCVKPEQLDTFGHKIPLGKPHGVTSNDDDVAVREDCRDNNQLSLSYVP